MRLFWLLSETGREHSAFNKITDQREKIIYIPQRNDLSTRASRSVVLQTLGHYALQHEVADEIGTYLRQRVESNYFAAAILAPEKPAVNFLRNAQKSMDISVEDLQEIFYISYEMAGHRLTNLATQLDITLHFLRSDDEGVLWKAYENDGVPLPQGNRWNNRGGALMSTLGNSASIPYTRCIVVTLPVYRHPIRGILVRHAWKLIEFLTMR